MKHLLFYLLPAVCILTIAGKCKKDSELEKITVATGPCFGKCALTATSIDRSLNVRYFGGMFSTRPGYFQGKADQPTWDSLVQKLTAIQYAKLDTVYRFTADDQSMEIIIHYGGKTKHIRAQSASLPAEAADAFYWVATLEKRLKLQSATMPDKAFETLIQGKQVPGDKK